MVISFRESDHTYTVNGILTPSVTTLIKEMHPDVYTGIPKRVLERKAHYGDRVHELVERAAEGNLPKEVSEKSYEGIALRRFIQLQVENDIHVASSEQLVCYIDKDDPLYAGKYDLLGTVHGKTAIIDIKTTAQYHADLLPIQLSMYVWAIEQMEKGLDIEEAYCLWLPKKGLGRMIPVNLLNKEKYLDHVRKAHGQYLVRVG